METLVKISKVKNMKNLEALRKLYHEFENCIRNLKFLRKISKFLNFYFNV